MIGEKAPGTPDCFDELRFAEDVGILLELTGGNRMAGRVWGMMVVAPEDELSSSDLTDRLRASAGSISTATRLLIGLGLLEPVRRPGDRKSYFRVRPGGLSNLVAQRQMVVTRGRQMAERGLEEFGSRPSARARLEEWKEVYAFWEQEIPKLIDRYEERRRRRSAGRE
jgi:DNA-binding transcriptional regulator GbsR (MarR family)